jgi:hypothetical protein
LDERNRLEFARQIRSPEQHEASALRRAKHLNVIDDRGARREARGDFASQRAFVLARYGTPEQDLTPAHDDANLGRVDLAVPMHLSLNASAQLDIRW